MGFFLLRGVSVFDGVYLVESVSLCAKFLSDLVRSLAPPSGHNVVSTVVLVTSFTDFSAGIYFNIYRPSWDR